MNAPHPVPLLGWAPTVTLAMPGSKSVANRLLVLADTRRHRRHTGGRARRADQRRRAAPARRPAHARLRGAARREERHRDDRGTLRAAPDHGELFCGNAGTALRFLVSLAAITKGTWTLTGDAAMQRRPIGPLVEAWRQLGVDVQATNGCPPVRVRSDGPPRGGTVSLDARQSSQFVSSLLLVGSRLENGLDVTFAGDAASLEYARLTCRTLATFGIDPHVRRTRRQRATTHAAARPRPCSTSTATGAAMGVWTCLAHATGSRVHRQQPAARFGSGRRSAGRHVGRAAAHGTAHDRRGAAARPVPQPRGARRAAIGHHDVRRRRQPARQGMRSPRGGGARTAKLGVPTSTNGPTASSCAAARPLHGGVVDPERPPRRDGVRAARPVVARHRDRRSGLRREELSRLLARPRHSCSPARRSCWSACAAPARATLARALAARTGGAPRRHRRCSSSLGTARSPRSSPVARLAGVPRASRAITGRCSRRRTPSSPPAGAPSSIAEHAAPAARTHARVLWLDATLGAAARTPRRRRRGAPVADRSVQCSTSSRPCCAAARRSTPRSPTVRLRRRAAARRNRSPQPSRPSVLRAGGAPGTP
jgi:hypothetical protein